MATFLSPDELRAATFVRYVEVHDSIDSTNNRAAALAGDPQLELSALVVGRLQTAGRGRGVNEWWSADGALTFSLLIDPASHGISSDRWPQLSLTSAVAVCDALQRETGTLASPTEGNDQKRVAGPFAPCSIKWPNDVFLNGRKVAGILLESPGRSPAISNRLIIGIGININNSFHATSPNACAANPSQEIAEHAIALCDHTGRSHDLQPVLTQLLCALERRIAELAAHAPQLSSTWQRLSLLNDQLVTVTSGSAVCTGRCVGIAVDGALVIETPQGAQQFHSGSVRIASPAH